MNCKAYTVSFDLQLWACGENVAVSIAAENMISRVIRCRCHLKRKEHRREGTTCEERDTRT